MAPTLAVVAHAGPVADRGTGRCKQFQVAGAIPSESACGNSAAAATYQATMFSPRQQMNVQSKLNLTPHVNFDAVYYYYDAIANVLPPVNRVDVGVSDETRQILERFTLEDLVARTRIGHPDAVPVLEVQIVAEAVES